MTSLPVDPVILARSRRRIFLALFTALAVVLHTFESLLPSPAPWFRFGFANILTLAALFLYGGSAAWGVMLGRIAVGSLILGNLFSPGFLLSLSGGVFATSLMTSSRALFGERIGPIGVSVLGAAGHATGQILVAWLLLVRHDALWRLFPFFLLVSLFTGVVNGWGGDALIKLLKRHKAFQGDSETKG